MYNLLALAIMKQPENLESHGRHIILDYVGYIAPQKDDGQWILEIMRDVIANSTAKEVHSHVTQFDGSNSPLGFAAVVVLDESHFSAHCYSELGWLAIDCFTCGSADTESIVKEFTDILQKKIPTLKATQRKTVERFLHD